MISEGCRTWLWHFYILFCVFHEELSETITNSNLGCQFYKTHALLDFFLWVTVYALNIANYTELYNK
jgi:hypothetical protein